MIIINKIINKHKNIIIKNYDYIILNNFNVTMPNNNNNNNNFNVTYYKYYNCEL